MPWSCSATTTNGPSSTNASRMLKAELNADGFCRKQFFAIEAAFLSVRFVFNLLSLYQKAPNTQVPYRQQVTLRSAVFFGGAALGWVGRKPVLHISSARGGFEKHYPLVEAILNWVIPTSPKLLPSADVGEEVCPIWLAFEPPNNPRPSHRGWLTAERVVEFQNLNVREPGERGIASPTSEFRIKRRLPLQAWPEARQPRCGASDSLNPLSPGYSKGSSTLPFALRRRNSHI